MNFDLNINNYKKNELIEMFDLPPNYGSEIVDIKEAKLRESILKNKEIKNEVRMKTIYFLTEAKKRNTLVQRIVNSALNLFCLRYHCGCHKKRRLLMYFVIEVFTEPYSLEEEIVKDKTKILVISHNINKIYKQIKKNEHSPGTDYLYQNLKSSNLEKTIAKLETMNSLGAEYIPRIA